MALNQATPKLMPMQTATAAAANSIGPINTASFTLESPATRELSSYGWDNPYGSRVGGRRGDVIVSPLHSTTDRGLAGILTVTGKDYERGTIRGFYDSHT